LLDEGDVHLHRGGGGSQELLERLRLIEEPLWIELEETQETQSVVVVADGQAVLVGAHVRPDERQVGVEQTERVQTGNGGHGAEHRGEDHVLCPGARQLERHQVTDRSGEIGHPDRVGRVGEGVLQVEAQLDAGSEGQIHVLQIDAEDPEMRTDRHVSGNGQVANDDLA
jgi:hypothetical protein